ncbi:MAG TPA: hypothetical protein VIX18_07005 [Nitrospirota bacterium]
MTACFKLMRVLQQPSRIDPEVLCASCVYFSKNLDTAEYPALMQPADHCGLGFLPADAACTEMRTDNCSTRRSKT